MKQRPRSSARLSSRPKLSRDHSVALGTSPEVTQLLSALTISASIDSQVMDLLLGAISTGLLLGTPSQTENGVSALTPPLIRAPLATLRHCVGGTECRAMHASSTTNSVSLQSRIQVQAQSIVP